MFSLAETKKKKKKYMQILQLLNKLKIDIT